MTALRRAPGGPWSDRRGLAAVFATGQIVLAAAAQGCGNGGGDDPDTDGGPIMFVDGGSIPNGPDGGDGGRPDTTDGGSAECVDDVCDPRDPDDDRCTAPDRCRLVSSEPTCASTGGASGPGALCRELGGCAPGLACFERRGGAACMAVCCPGDEAAGSCDEGERCAEVARLVDGTETSWGICTVPRPCDIFAPEDVCEPGEGCYVADGEGATDCRVAGVADVGSPCETQRDCVPEAFCAGRPGDAACAAFCTLEDDSHPCPRGERCVSSAATPDGLGLCIR